MSGDEVVHIPAWRRFKRMQASICLFASLVFAGAAVHAWRLLPGPQALKAAVVVAFPAFYALAAFVVPLQVSPLRRWLKRYVWMTFTAGFGQTAASVLLAFGLVATAAVFIYLQIASAAHGGRYPAGVFSAFGAGLGIIYAQALLVSALERDPEVRAVIET